MDNISEIQLQAAGLEKQNWSFGISPTGAVYKDSKNVFLVDNGYVWFHYRV